MAYYQQHMFSIKSRTTLANILAQIILINETNQSFRQAIANSPYFDSIALFRFLDKQQKGYFSEKDLQQMIGTTHRKLLTYAFSWIDTLKTGQVSRLQFAAFLLPRDNLELRQLMAQRVQHPEIHQSSQQNVFEQFSIFREMILQIIRRQMRIIELRRKLLSQPEYSVKGALLAIYDNRHDWVCVQDLFKFLKNFGYQMTLRQVEKLVETINTALDGKVSEQQLKWVIEGLESTDRDYLDKIKQVNKRKISKKPISFEKRFQKHRSKSKAKRQAQKRYEEQKYQSLVHRLQQVQKQETKIDQNLLLKEKINMQTIQDRLQKQKLNLQAKRKLQEQQRQKQRLIRQVKYSMNRQIDSFLQQTASLEAQSEQLARLQNRAAIQQDLSNIKQTIMQPQIPTAFTLKTRPNRLPSFGLIQEDSFQFSNRYDLLPFESRNTRMGVNFDFYTAIEPNLTSDSIKRHLQSSDLYLQTAREIKQKIKRQRQVERDIRNQFLNGQILSRYKSQLHSKENISKPNKEATQKKPGLIRGTEERMDLGLQSAYKMTSIAKNRPTQQKKYYESPQHQYVKGSILDKYNLSTANKLDH